MEFSSFLYVLDGSSLQDQYLILGLLGQGGTRPTSILSTTIIGQDVVAL
jgi:hypothetical protein